MGWTVAFILYLIPILRTLSDPDFAKKVQLIYVGFNRSHRIFYMASLIVGALIWPVIVSWVVFKTALSKVIK